MESQRLGEVFNSLSANINVRRKKHYLHIFVVLTFILFSYKTAGAKEYPVGPFYVVNPYVSAEVSKASYACRRYLIKYQKKIIVEQGAYSVKYHFIFSKLQAERIVLNAGIGAKKTVRGNFG